MCLYVCVVFVGIVCVGIGSCGIVFLFCIVCVRCLCCVLCAELFVLCFVVLCVFVLCVVL